MIVRSTKPWCKLVEIDSGVSNEIKQSSSVFFGIRKSQKGDSWLSSTGKGKENVGCLEFTIQKGAELYDPPFIISERGSQLSLNKKKLNENDRRILSDGDIIASKKIAIKLKFIDLRERSLELLEEANKKYYIGRVINNGKCGEMYMAHDRKTFEKVVIKSVSKFHLIEKLLEYNCNELTIMQQLDHPHILKLFHVEPSSLRTHLVLQNMNEGDMFQLIQRTKTKTMPEEEAKFAFYQVARGLQYLHSKSFVHLDIKPENILVHTKLGERLYKLADFGLSCKDTDSLPRCGTLSYAPPEMLEDDSVQVYGKKCDMWSFGVTIYNLLCGEHLFNDRKEVQRAYVSFAKPAFHLVSEQAKRLILSLVKKDPSQRFAVQEVLASKWFDSKIKVRYRKLGLIFGQPNPENAPQKAVTNFRH